MLPLYCSRSSVEPTMCANYCLAAFRARAHAEDEPLRTEQSHCKAKRAHSCEPPALGRLGVAMPLRWRGNRGGLRMLLQSWLWLAAGSSGRTVCVVAAKCIHWAALAHVFASCFFCCRTFSAMNRAKPVQPS